MSKIRAVVILLAGTLAAGGWYWFRPERALIDVRVMERLPAPPARILASGRFRPEAHDGRGRADIVQLQDGRLVLRLREFETLNGPDVRVYLLGRADGGSRSALSSAGYVDLGALKGNVGEQYYVIPDGTDLARYPAVSVWCRRFSVNFTMFELSTL